MPSDNLEPPTDLTPDATAEWNRIIAAVTATGHPLKSADRTILTLYVKTWIVNQTAYQHVAKYGAVIKWSNGQPGNSPQYKTFIETAKQLRSLLADMGCTPASRSFDIPQSSAQAKPEPISF